MLPHKYNKPPKTMEIQPKTIFKISENDSKLPKIMSKPQKNKMAILCIKITEYDVKL